MSTVTHLPTKTEDAGLPSNPADLIFNDHAFARLERVAQIMASGKATVPQHLRGSVGDCFAILLQAARWGMDPYAVSQKTHVVNGALGYEAQLVIAVINNNAPIHGRLTFEWFGPWEKVTDGKKDRSDAGVRVGATMRGDSEPTTLEVTMAQVGVRNSQLWTDDPRQQLAYLAAKRWARLHCPDVILGVYTPDELQERDMGPAEVVAKTEPKPAASSLKERMKAARAFQPEPEESQESLFERIKRRFEEARTMTDLDEAKSEAAPLQGALLHQARALYKQCREEIRQAEKDREPELPFDTETGEITQGAEGE